MKIEIDELRGQIQDIVKHLSKQQYEEAMGGERVVGSSSLVPVLGGKLSAFQEVINMLAVYENNNVEFPPEHNSTVREKGLESPEDEYEQLLEIAKLVRPFILKHDHKDGIYNMHLKAKVKLQSKAINPISFLDIGIDFSKARI